ncbi:DNRLRE domain-containing protein, partial [Kurthia sibirica]
MKKINKLLIIVITVSMIISMLPDLAIKAYAESINNVSTEKDVKKKKVSTDNLTEINKERTPYTKTFTDGNGQYFKEIYAEKVHSKENKNYEEIDDNLVSIGTDYISTHNTELNAKFPQSIKNDQTIDYTSGEHTLSFEIDSAKSEGNVVLPTSKSKTSLNENEIQYKNIYDGIDLRHITLNEEVKEDWIVNQFTGIHEFKYQLKTDLKAELLSDGSIAFYTKDAKKQQIFKLPKPMMMDSNINDQKGEGVYSDKVHYILSEKENNSYELTLSADKDWLKSDKRVYPVYIDPSVTIDALGDTYISSKYPKANFNKQWDPAQGEYILQTGYYDSTSGTNYPFIKFSVVGDLKGATIDSADLQAYVTHAYYADQKNGLWVDEVKGAWTADGLTWNNKPSSTKIASTSVGRDEWAHFDVQDTIQAWVSGERSNYGFKFHTNGNGKTYWKKITAAESAKKAKIVIAYHYEAGPKPTVSATAYNDGSNNGYTNVKWKSVYGATGYKLMMYDGSEYKEVYNGTATSWTSKGKKIFPKAPYSTTSTYVAEGKGVELPNDPSAFFAKKGTANYLYYKYRVIPIFPTGNGTQSELSTVKIPKEIAEVTDAPDQPKIVGYQYAKGSSNDGRGWLDISWNKVVGATNYKVLIWNGKKYSSFSVGNKTSVTTKGKKIYPTEAEITAGTLDFHDASLADTSKIGTGTELPMYPGKSYNNTSKRYSVRIIAESDGGNSPNSDIAYGYIPLYAPDKADVTIKANEDDLVENKTTLTTTWKNNDLATRYDVTIKGEKTGFKKTYTVKKTSGTTTSYTPSTTFAIDDNYSVYVQPYFYDSSNAPADEADNSDMDDVKRGISPMPSSAQSTVKSNAREDLIGLENYFTYDESTFGNATASVNVTTGNMAVQFTDESLYTRSDLGYDFTRTYNSRSTTSSALGKGWTFVGNETLTEDGEKGVYYADEDGTVHRFNKSGDTFTSPKGLNEQLKKNDTTYTMTDQNGFIQTYQESPQTGTYVLSSYTDEYGNEISFKRNEKGQVTEVAETKGTSNQENIKISYADNRVSQVQYGDHWTKYSYTNDQLTQTIIGSDQSTRTIVENFTYDANGQLTKYVDGKKNETTFKYNANELIIFDKQATDAELSVTNTYQFDTKNNEYKSIDSSDNETVYKRDEKNDTYAVVEENAPGDDEQKTTSFYSYDEQYNLLEVINPDATTEKNTYDPQGNLLTSSTKEGTVTNTYNSRNQLTSTKDINGEETTYTYDGPELIRSKTKEEETTFAYDTYGRVTKTTYANGTFEQVDYDDEQRQVTSTDKKGNTTSVVYSIYGQKVKETDADGHTKSYTYDPMYPSTILSVTDGNGHKTAYQYDNNNNLTALTDALNRQKTYTYNDNDQVTTVTMPNMKFSYVYDENGEISKSTLPSGIETSYTYNSDSQLAQIQNGNETIDYNYDENGNTTSILRDTKTLKTYGYTAETNLLANYTLGLFKQNYGYDDQERNNAVTTAYGEDFEVKEATTFKENSDDVDRIKISADQVSHDYQSEIDVPNNKTTLTLNDDLWKQVTQMNDANLLGSLTYTTKAQQPFKIGYEYTKAGNIVQTDVNGQVSSFIYDANDQLTKETLPDGTINTYDYDAVGNRTASEVNGEKATFTYNDANQIATKNETAYTYDADGNLLKDEHYKYTYNEQQRLTKVATLDDQIIASYTYDENGLR